MDFWLFVTIIVVVPVLAGTFIEYHKNNKKYRASTDRELEELRTEIGTMRKRLENLETIAAGAPDEFVSSPNSTDENPAREIHDMDGRKKEK